MPIPNTITPTRCVLILLAVLAFAGSTPATAQTPTLTDLFTFTGESAGTHPFAGLIQASNGTLYGTTRGAGVPGDWGAVFAITPSGAVTPLYRFTGGADGGYSYARLTLLPSGDLIGTTHVDGANGYGTVFRITTAGVLTTLHAFNDSDGANPTPSPIRAEGGSLYGTTANGGAYGSGTIYKMTQQGALTTVHSFDGTDGSYPAGELLLAADGNIYGTTDGGGANSEGTIWQVTPSGAFTIVHDFTGADGSNVSAGLIQAQNGALYGATYFGGANDAGTVFKISKGGILTTLHSFSGSDGSYPSAALIQAGDGNLYGVTHEDGANGYGTIFRITTAGVLTTLHSFSGSDGANPSATLVQASDGDLYGTTAYGGSAGIGVVYRLSGVYPVPVLISFSPSSANAAGPTFTLKVTGASFQTFSKVNWNGSPLKTTYVSPAALTAAVPAALIAASGKASITVVTPAGGGTSKSKLFTLFVTALRLLSATLTKNSAGNYTANITLKNGGYLNAPNVQLTQADLGSAVTTTTLPVNLGSIAKGKTGTTLLGFPASAGSSGSVVILKVSGTFTGGTFRGSLKVTLP